MGVYVVRFSPFAFFPPLFCWDSFGLRRGGWGYDDSRETEEENAGWEWVYYVRATLMLEDGDQRGTVGEEKLRGGE